MKHKRRGGISLMLAVVLCMGAMLSFTSFSASASASAVTDTSWFTSSGTDFYLYDDGDLFGLASLVNGGESFEGKNIHLLYDVTVNTENLSDTSVDTESLIQWTPIGNSASNPFKGNFDGHGHTISGLYVETKTTRVGLFGEAQGAEIKNIRIENSYFDGLGKVGSILGYARKSEVGVSNCYSNATIKALIEQNADTSGGIVGHAATSININDCIFDGTILGIKNVGGILGWANNTSSLSVNISRCINKGTLHANGEECGEFIGKSEKNASICISNSLSMGSATATDVAADWIGSTYSGLAPVITDCYTDGGSLLIGADNADSGINDTAGSVTIASVFDDGVSLPLSVKLASVTDTYNMIKTVTGASVRLSTPTGLRFTSEVNIEAYSVLKALGAVFEMGTIITPTDYLSAYGVIAPQELIGDDGISDSDAKYLHVAATPEVWFANPEDTEGTYISGAIVSLNTKNYGRSFSAVAYCTVTLNGESTVYYSPNVSNRSVAEVARAAYDAGDYENDLQKSALESFFQSSKEDI